MIIQKRGTQKLLYLLGALFCFLVLWLLLQFILPGRLVLPQALSLGKFSIRYYGIIMMLAVFAAYGLARMRMEFFNIKEAEIEILVWYLIIFGFLGARLYHVASSASYYSQHPGQIFAVWHGGLSIFGALLGGALGLLLAKRFFKQNVPKPFLLYADWLAPSLLLGQIIGRFGNLFNYEAFGYPTNLPWRMFVPNSFRPEGFTQFSYFHPFFLYESLANVLVLLCLLFLERTGQLRR